MDSESQRIYDRMTLHKLSMNHPDWSVVQLADTIGRCERWARKWLKRFAERAEPSFKMYLSQSCAPKTRPRQTPPAVKAAICALRERLSEQDHRPACATLIQHYLQQEMEHQETDASIPIYHLKQKTRDVRWSCFSWLKASTSLSWYATPATPDPPSLAG